MAVSAEQTNAARKSALDSCAAEMAPCRDALRGKPVGRETGLKTFPCLGSFLAHPKNVIAESFPEVTYGYSWVCMCGRQKKVGGAQNVEDDTANLHFIYFADAFIQSDLHFYENTQG